MSAEEAAAEIREASRRLGILRLLVFSIIGAVAFFVPVTWQGRSTIPIDHLVTLVRESVGGASRWIACALMAVGVVVPLVTGQVRRTRTDAAFWLLNVIGLGLGIMISLQVGPRWLLAADMGDYLMDKVVVPVGLIVPIGAIFLSLLTNYGLMEFIGVLMQRVMRPLFQVPGRASLDAVASFVGSYSLGLLITGRLYREGRYTAREAAIIATGFSTVSTTFMVIVAKTLGLMDRWQLYFWSTLVITFLVTTITVRLWPLRGIPDDTAEGVEHRPEKVVTGNRLGRAWSEAMTAARNAEPLPRALVNTLRAGVLMASTILPAVLVFGAIGLLIARNTPIFDWVGLVFRPVLWLFGLPDADVVSTGAAASLADMFVPALLAAEIAPAAKLVVGILCVSEIIFFSGVVPCIHATGIPISIGKLVAVWFWRVLFTLTLATPWALLVT